MSHAVVPFKQWKSEVYCIMGDSLQIALVERANVNMREIHSKGRTPEETVVFLTGSTFAVDVEEMFAESK